MKIELPIAYPAKICLESISKSGSLPPQYASSKRMTLFGSGELYSVRIKGYLPAYTMIDNAGKHVRDLSLWSANPTLSPMLEHLVLIEGRLALNARTKLNNLSFSWEEEDGSRGNAEIFRKTLSQEQAADILSSVYNQGISRLPDLIGYAAPGASASSIIFCCRLNSTLFEKEIRFSSYEADKVLASKYQELRHLIATKLEKALKPADPNKKGHPWWQFWK